MRKICESSFLQKGLDFIFVWIKTIMPHLIDQQQLTVDVFFDPFLQGLFKYTLVQVPDQLTTGGVIGSVPLLGITLLNETVIRESCYRPDQILGKLRNKIIEAFGQQGKINEVKDGMDGDIVNYNLETGTLAYSGALNRSIIVRNGIFNELKGDRMPLSYSGKKKDFSLTEIPVKKNDIIYLFSDGYPDQFGGPADKKFGMKKFRELILDCYKHSMADQRKIFLEKVESWRGGAEQIDDITVVGLKI